MRSQEALPTTARRHVFMAYTNADAAIARTIMHEMEKRGTNAWVYHYQIEPGDSLSTSLGRAISASDYLIVLLSRSSTGSAWAARELDAPLLTDLSNRGITLLPVLVEDCELPPALSSYQIFDLRDGAKASVTTLVDQIELIPEIDFSRLDGGGFEHLVTDLLGKLGFRTVRHAMVGSDDGVDFLAEYTYRDPFEAEVTETWGVEAKFHRYQRADPRSLWKLATFLSLHPRVSKGLLVTNGQLTSAARSSLDSVQARSRAEIRVIDGAELRRLLLKHQDLVTKHFGSANGSQM